MNKIIIITFLIILIALLVYFIQKKRNDVLLLLNDNNSLLLDKIDSSSMTIKNNEDIPPSLLNSFTISFWFYMEDFFTNEDQWRHIIHIGGAFTDTIIKNWKDVTNIIPKQYPGIWLNPKLNSLRFAITDGIDELVYGDLENIPTNKLTHITLVFDNKIIAIYLNGKLMTSKVIMNDPKYIKDHLYFFHPRTVSSKLFDFVYYNKSVGYNGVKALFNRTTAKKLKKNII